MFGLLALACSGVVAQIKTESNQLAADQCRSLLRSSIVDFYLPNCVDSSHGGYLEDLDESGQFTTSEKFLTLQARQLWFFSTLAVLGEQKEASLKAAESGYEFLRSHFYDAELGGYFTKTDAAGSVIDARKHAYPNAFVIYAFVEYYRATGDLEVLVAAKELFRTLDKHCYDRQHAGYQEFFYSDWRLITDPTESGYVGAINTKTYNTHLHLLEAFAQLYREWPDPLVAERLSELIDINVNTVRHPEHFCNIDGFQRDWTMIATPRNLRASYGHDVECAWLVLDAVKALGRSASPYRSWAKHLCDHAIHYGFDSKHGGFFYTGPLGKASDDRKKEWWTQNEAMVAMLVLEDLTGDSSYRGVFDSTFEFVQSHQIAPEGGWWGTVREDGQLGDRRVRTSMWQGAYHNARSLILCEKLLRK